MKTTTFQIGNEGGNAPNEIESSNQTTFKKDRILSANPENGRRGDIHNVNRTMTFGFGFGSEKGTQEHQVIHRAKTFYNQYFEPKKPDMQPSETLAINKERSDYGLANKFEYGFDVKGGIKGGKVPDRPEHMVDCLEKSAVGRGESLVNREKIERQNFTIKPAKQLVNSETKYIGTHGGKGIENKIDQEDLKRSHQPRNAY